MKRRHLSVLGIGPIYAISTFLFTFIIIYVDKKFNLIKQMIPINIYFRIAIASPLFILALYLYISSWKQK